VIAKIEAAGTDITRDKLEYTAGDTPFSRWEEEKPG
jgi:hypothetical protein